MRRAYQDGADVTPTYSAGRKALYHEHQATRGESGEE
jgi:hypothetical protein